MYVLVAPENVYECLDNFDIRKSKSTYSTLTLRKKGKHKSSWSIEDNFSLTVCTVNAVNCDMKRNIEVSNIKLQFVYVGNNAK